MEKEILQQEKAVDVVPTTSLGHFKKFKDTTDCKAKNFFLHSSFKNLPPCQWLVLFTRVYNFMPTFAVTK